MEEEIKRMSGGGNKNEVKEQKKKEEVEAKVTVATEQPSCSERKGN